MIHPTAVIENGAELGSDIEVGAHAYVGPTVQLGDGCFLHHHASVEGVTVLGKQCEVFPHACVGPKTQDLKYKGGKPGLRVGERNVFRECTTIHCATNDGDFTVIGDDNYFLAYSHVGHDCVLGNHIIASNNATLAGHVIVDDYVIISGLTGIHQFCHVGMYSFLGGCSKVTQDIPPYLIGDGNPAVIRSINRVGLERAGFSPEQIARVKFAYSTLYREGLNRSQALEKLKEHGEANEAEIQNFIKFSEKGVRGFTPGVRI
ncbi:MAG: acyl-ACP--UDP-N-acetylglucosamine O-acyltransferase [Opitutaceae bacterium]|nr:acyl-ACP--UDP-N-acetylglucosamine O-acyltransferase [Opitutaceae bacterium]